MYKNTGGRWFYQASIQENGTVNLSGEGRPVGRNLMLRRDMEAFTDILKELELKS